MKNRMMKLGALAVSVAILLSGCSADDEFWAETGEADYSDSENIESAPDSAPATPDSERTASDSATRISMSSGSLEITRRTRETTVPMGEGNWTIFVYMCGSDLESEINAATADILEALNGTESDKVNIVFQTGGANSWYEDIISNSTIQRYIVSDGDIQLVDELENRSMGSPDTLASFVEWGVRNYPAENMGLVFWNHGGGSISGVCFDEQNSYDSLTLREIDSALNSVFDLMTDKFEFIGFDACLMSTLETANILVPYANYMIASEETEPGSGWDYTAITNFLAQNPSADGAALGREICDSFKASCDACGDGDGVTLAVTDLSKIDALLTAFDNAANQMYYSGDNFPIIVKSILTADNFGGNNRSEGYTNMVDLASMMNGVSGCASGANAVLSALDEAIVYKVSGRQHSGAGGLSLYYPLSVQGSTELSTFADVCPSAYYLAFADAVAYGKAGGNVQDYDNSDIVGDSEDIWDDTGYEGGDYTDDSGILGSENCAVPVGAVYFNEDGIYTVQIEDFTNFAYAECSLFLQDDDGTLIYLGSDDEVYIDYDAGLITDAFEGHWLCLDDGTYLPMCVVYADEDISLYTCEILLNGNPTNLRFIYDWNAEEFEVIGAWDGIDENGMAAKDIVKLKDGDVIQPIYRYYGEDYEDYFLGGEYVVNGEVGFEYMELPEGDYYYSMTINDIYGNWTFTPDVTFTVDEYGDIYFYPDELG